MLSIMLTTPQRRQREQSLPECRWNQSSFVLSSNAAPSPLKRDHNGSSSGNDGNVKSTNVKVCVRLRSMLSSNFKNNAATETSSNKIAFSGSGNADPVINSTPSKEGKGFARKKLLGEMKINNKQQQQVLISQSTHTNSHTAHHDPTRLADYSFDQVRSVSWSSV